MRVKDVLGEFGERLAAEHLEAAGMRVVDRRWRCSLGELDLVAVDGDWLVVCEVKTRRSLVAGSPFEAVTPRKLLRLRKLAGAWIEAHEGPWRDVRIDVVAVLVPRRGTVSVERLAGVA